MSGLGEVWRNGFGVHDDGVVDDEEEEHQREHLKGLHQDNGGREVDSGTWEELVSIQGEQKK